MTGAPSTASTHAPAQRGGRRPRLVRLPTWAIAAIDVVIVVVFASVGRTSHGGITGLGDVARVAWPFLVALGLAWLIVGAVRRSAPRDLAAGSIVWLVTLAGGVLLRGLTGGGTHWTFVLVAATFLALTLIGWRALAARRA